MKFVNKLLKKAEKRDSDYKKKQVAEDRAAVARTEARIASKVKKAMKHIDAYKKEREDIASAIKQQQGGVALSSLLARGGRGSKMLQAAREEQFVPIVMPPKKSIEEVLKGTSVGKELFGGNGYYYRRRKRPFVKKGRSSLKRRRYRWGVYKAAYDKLNSPLEEMPPVEEDLAMFPLFSRKRAMSSRSTPDISPAISPPRLAIKLEDLGSLLYV